MIVIYDKKGDIIATRADESNTPEGIPYLVTEVPKGQVIVGVDVSVEPNAPIFEDVYEPETIPEKLQAVQEELVMLTECLLEMSEALYA